MQRIFKFATGAVMVFTMIVSCSKQGPAGPAGATGPAGPKGDTGVAGPAGNGNVIISPWTDGFSSTNDTWTVPAITKGVLDTSVVLVFARDVGSTAQFQLPYSLPDGFYVVDYIIPGGIALFCYSSADLSSFEFRYVIIPWGVVPTGLPQSYEEIIRSLGIAP
ncbi:MAG TPA: hypothetical protein VKR41_07205 [Puia sp.]|nr:hypothetical protein [Puia sp.]